MSYILSTFNLKIRVPHVLFSKEKSILLICYTSFLFVDISKVDRLKYFFSL